jgi:diketogulonate reductase-like aldo/keto reductase
VTSSRANEKRRLGSSGPWVSPVGLGCMGMSGTYGPADDAESMATMHAALDAGITLVDTGAIVKRLPAFSRFSITVTSRGKG